MVRFEKDRYIIEVKTVGLPIEDWQELNNELAYVFTLLTQENMPTDGVYQLANLLRELQPDTSVAERMVRI